MALTLKTTAKHARVQYDDGSMTVSWVVSASLEDDELAAMLERIAGFYRAQTGAPALPERVPGMALGMAQAAHPRLVEVTEEQGMAMKKAKPGSVANGWAPYAGAAKAHPEIPEGAEYELIPPEEQG